MEEPISNNRPNTAWNSSTCMLVRPVCTKARNGNFRIVRPLCLCIILISQQVMFNTRQHIFRYSTRCETVEYRPHIPGTIDTIADSMVVYPTPHHTVPSHGVQRTRTNKINEFIIVLYYSVSTNKLRKLPLDKPTLPSSVLQYTPSESSTCLLETDCLFTARESYSYKPISIQY